MEFKKKTKNISKPFEMSYSGIKNITLKEKYVYFFIYLDVQPQEVQVQKWASTYKQLRSICAMGEI